MLDVEAAYLVDCGEAAQVDAGMAHKESPCGRSEGYVSLLDAIITCFCGINLLAAWGYPVQKACTVLSRNSATRILDDCDVLMSISTSAKDCSTPIWRCGFFLCHLQF